MPKVNLDIFLRAINDTSKGFKGAEHDAKVSAASIQRAFAGAMASAGAAGSMDKLSGWSGKGGAVGKLLKTGTGVMDILGEMFGTGGKLGMLFGPEVGIITSTLGAGLSGVAKAFSAVGRAASSVMTFVINTLEKATGAAMRLGSGLLRIGGIGALAAAAGFLMVGKSATEAQMEVEGFKAKLETALKSPEAANKMYDWAVAFADATPFDTGPVIDATTRLTLYGLEATHWLPLIGNMAGAMGRDVTDGVEAIADAVNGGGLERLKEFGINSLKLLQAGAKGSAQGGIDYSSAEGVAGIKQALETVLTRDFGGGMEKFSKSGKSWLSNFMSAVWKRRSDIGQGFMPAFKDALAVGIGYLTGPGAQEAAQGLGKMMGRMLTWAVGAVKGAIESGVFQDMWASVKTIGQSIYTTFIAPFSGKSANILQGTLNAIATGLRWIANIANPENLGKVKGVFIGIWNGLQWLVAHIPHAAAAFLWLKDAGIYAFGSLMNAMPSLLEGFGKLAAGIMRLVATLGVTLGIWAAGLIFTWSRLIAIVIDLMRLIPGMKYLLGDVTGKSIKQVGDAASDTVLKGAASGAVELGANADKLQAGTNAAAARWRANTPEMQATPPKSFAEYLKQTQEWWKGVLAQGAKFTPNEAGGKQPSATGGTGTLTPSTGMKGGIGALTPSMGDYLRNLPRQLKTGPGFWDDPRVDAVGDFLHAPIQIPQPKLLPPKPQTVQLPDPKLELPKATDSASPQMRRYSQVITDNVDALMKRGLEAAGYPLDTGLLTSALDQAYPQAVKHEVTLKVSGDPQTVSALEKSPGFRGAVVSIFGEVVAQASR